MQMSTGCGGDFTTNASVVVQISKRQDLRPVSQMPTTLRLSFLRKVTTRRRFIINCFKFLTKIAFKGEGRKPSSDREKYVAESELALLSILYKLIIMIYFFHRIAVSNTDKGAEIINT